MVKPSLFLFVTTCFPCTYFYFSKIVIYTNNQSSTILINFKVPILIIEIYSSAKISSVEHIIQTDTAI